MAIKALSKVTPDWYIPDIEKESDRHTRFKLRPLTPPERERVTEFVNGIFSIPPKNYGEVLKYGIVDWDNFDDENGKPLKCTIINHSRIPADIRMELAGEILIRSTISEEEEKN